MRLDDLHGMYQQAAGARSWTGSHTVQVHDSAVTYTTAPPDMIVIDLTPLHHRIWLSLTLHHCTTGYDCHWPYTTAPPDMIVIDSRNNIMTWRLYGTHVVVLRI